MLRCCCLLNVSRLVECKYCLVYEVVLNIIYNIYIKIRFGLMFL